jgi:hypothetical protein
VPRKARWTLVLGQHLIFGYVVVDLAKDPFYVVDLAKDLFYVVDLAKDPSTAGPSARWTTLIFNVDAALGRVLHFGGIAGTIRRRFFIE